MRLSIFGQLSETGGTSPIDAIVSRIWPMLRDEGFRESG